MASEINKPIRVLHILHSMNRGGAENALMNYYRSIDREQVQFDFLLTASAKCDFEDEILSLGGLIYRVPVLSMKNPFRYISSVNIFFKNHPEYRIAHSHTSSKSVFPLAIAKFRGVPVRISHSHSSKSENGFWGVVRNIFKPFLKVTANVYFSCGEQASDWLYGEQMIRSGKVTIIRNVIEAKKFRYRLAVRLYIREKLGIADDAFVIGNVARFCDVKNHRFSVEILKETCAMIPNTILLLVGDGPLRENIIAYAKELGVESNIKMVGVVPNVYDYEQAMDAFILPSFYEGLPLSIIEAQVSGLPCFTTSGAVSDECSVTELVTYLPLEAGAAFWAKEITRKRGLKRVDRFEQIKDAGYDSETAANNLQNQYMELSQQFKG